ncbi:MAG: alpha/beta hydrolase, partial [Treponemataceae bacterium]|nr:alpha/beta hydrolase [Treponemataceae bacterium]
MEKISVKSCIGYILFVFAFFGISAYTLFVIDARLYGWIIWALLLAGLTCCRFRKFPVAGWKKLCVYVAALLALHCTCEISRPDLGVSYRGTLVREFIREARNLPMMKGDGMLSAGAALSAGGSSWKAPKGYTNTGIDCGAPIELLQKNGSTSETLVFQIHGGAYVIGMIDSYRNQAVKFSRMVGDASVLNIDYRIAPEYVFPAALEDAEMAWDWILANGWKPENVIMVGDSAGGNLVLALCLKLRDEGRALPGKIVCMSPWGDLAGEGVTHKENLYKDPMFGISPHSWEAPENAATAALGSSAAEGEKPKKSMTALYAGDTDVHEPYLSPVFGFYDGFPPMLIQVGSFEVLQSDSETIYQKARNAGVDATLSVFNGMYHVFQQAGEFIPEGKKAWKEIAA